MKAFAFFQNNGVPQLLPADIPMPSPQRGDLLIEVKAAGVIQTELSWYPTTHNQDGSPRTAAVPSHEFSGVVAKVGPEVSHFSVGDEVYGMNDWFGEGATAEYCLAPASSVTLKPPSMTHVAAAAVPISALTAWQALVKRANAQPRERVLIIGAAGAVGLMAVQFARNLGCHIVALAAKEQFELLKRLGAHDLIDYRSSRFEEMTEHIDVVLDTVGSDYLHRAEPLLNAGARVSTIAADAEGKADPVIANAFFIVEPSAEELRTVGRLIGKGELEVFVKAVLPFEEVPAAYQNKNLGAGQVGKLVLQVSPVS